MPRSREHRDAVPETWSSRATTLRDAAPHRAVACFADAFMRLRVSDGFSHARSLAYTIVARARAGDHRVVGLVTALGERQTRTRSCARSERAVPGPAGEMLTTAVAPGAPAPARRGQYLGLIFGLVGSLVTGATLMGQLERALNRLYGVETDRADRSRSTASRSCSRSRPACWPRSRSSPSRSARPSGDAIDSNRARHGLERAALAARARCS